MSKTNTRDERAFFDAIAGGDCELVKRMAETNPELLAAYDTQCFGATPITRVCHTDNREMIQTLIGLGADVDRRSDWKMGPWSPLHVAVSSQKSDLARYLLECGATLDAHAAAGLGRLDDLRRLLDEDPGRVHEPGGDGCQPLHFADSVEVADLLLERGADIDARCIDHYSTPVQYLSSCRPQVARHLFARGACPDIFSAIMCDDRPLVQRMIHVDPQVLEARLNQDYFPPGNGFDVHNVMTFTIGHDAGPLHAAARGNVAPMVDLLVAAGQSPNLRGGYDDQTPLHTAAWNNHVEVASRLLDHGADINARSGKIHNNSPAGWAIVAGSADVFELLMDRGAEVLSWFLDDANAALAGEFLRYRWVPQSQYERILKRLKH